MKDKEKNVNRIKPNIKVDTSMIDVIEFPTYEAYLSTEEAVALFAETGIIPKFPFDLENRHQFMTEQERDDFKKLVRESVKAFKERDIDGTLMYVFTQKYNKALNDLYGKMRYQLTEKDIFGEEEQSDIFDESDIDEVLAGVKTDKSYPKADSEQISFEFMKEIVPQTNQQEKPQESKNNTENQ